MRTKLELFGISDVLFHPSSFCIDQWRNGIRNRLKICPLTKVRVRLPPGLLIGKEGTYMSESL